MNFCFLALTDTPLGKLDPKAFRPQVMLETFFRNFDANNVLWNGEAEAPDITEWRGLTFDGDTLKEINLKQAFEGGGAMTFQWLPDGLRTFDMTSNSLRGTIPLGDLPRSLEVLSIRENLLEGSIDLRALPASLQTCHLSGNNFTGCVVLDNLPQGLQTLNIYDNELHGSLDLKHFPVSLLVFNAQKNNFSGEISLCALPPRTHKIRLDQNKLHGNVNLHGVPDSLMHIDLRKNKFSSCSGSKRRTLCVRI